MEKKLLSILDNLFYAALSMLLTWLQYKWFVVQAWRWFVFPLGIEVLPSFWHFIAIILVFQNNSSYQADKYRDEYGVEVGKYVYVVIYFLKNAVLFGIAYLIYMTVMVQ